MLALIVARYLLLSALYYAVLPGVAKYGHPARTKRDQVMNAEPGVQGQPVKLEAFISEVGLVQTRFEVTQEDR
jgi:hypothetical protein